MHTYVQYYYTTMHIYTKFHCFLIKFGESSRMQTFQHITSCKHIGLQDGGLSLYTLKWSSLTIRCFEARVFKIELFVLICGILWCTYAPNFISLWQYLTVYEQNVNISTRIGLLGLRQCNGCGELMLQGFQAIVITIELWYLSHSCTTLWCIYVQNIISLCW